MRNLYYVKTIRGMPIRLHYTWVIAAFLGVLALAEVVVPAYLPTMSGSAQIGLALLIVILYFLAVALHECAHLLVANIFKVHLGVLNLYPLGAITRMPSRYRSGWAEFWIAAAGPTASIALWWLLATLATQLTPGWLAAAAGIVGRLSLYVGLINLLPGLPLDGGRMLHRLIYEIYGSFDAATRITRIFGEAIAYGLMLLGMTALIADQSWPRALALVGTGWVIRQAGGTAHRRELLARVLHKLTATDIQIQPAQTVGPEQSLRQFAISLRGRFGNAPTPVIANGVFLGLIDRELTREVPPGYWDVRTVSETMLPASSLDVVAPTTPLSMLIPRLAGSLDGEPSRPLPVVQEGQLLGLVDAEEILSVLELEDEFGLFGRGMPGNAPRSSKAHMQVQQPAANRIS